MRSFAVFTYEQCIAFEQNFPDSAGEEVKAKLQVLEN